jgi:hypothetical protein
MRTRTSEQDLVKRCVFVAENDVAVDSADEAAVCRLVAQLVKTRFPTAAASLDRAAIVYYTLHQVRPKTYPEVVRGGLVTDLPRFRNLMERELAGHNSW